jgi:hypothetical protein
MAVHVVGKLVGSHIQHCRRSKFRLLATRGGSYPDTDRRNSRGFGAFFVHLPIDRLEDRRNGEAPSCVLPRGRRKYIGKLCRRVTACLKGTLHTERLKCLVQPIFDFQLEARQLDRSGAPYVSRFPVGPMLGCEPRLEGIQG